jgi:hypothetical protein
MDGGVVRNAVQPKDLVETEAEEDLEEGFLGAPLGFAGDHPIESGLPAGYAVGQLLREGAVRRGQPPGGQGFFQNGFQTRPRSAVLLQDLDGNFSWFLGTHRIIMPVA